MSETDTILPDFGGDDTAAGPAMPPELLPLAVAPPAFTPDPSGEDAPQGQAGPRPTIDIEYPCPPASDRAQGEPGIGNDPGFAITPKNAAGGNIDPGFDITPKNLPVSPSPQGRLTTPVLSWNQPSTLADPIDRQVHYYGSLVDRADDYKAINGHDPSGQDLADIQAHAQAEAFRPGETPLALFANAAATPVAASAPIAAGPPMSDTGEAAPAAPAPGPAPAPPPAAVADPGADANPPAAPATPSIPAAPADAPPQGQAAPPDSGTQAPPPDAKTEAPAASPPSQPQAETPVEGAPAAPNQPAEGHVVTMTPEEIAAKVTAEGNGGYLAPKREQAAGNGQQCSSLVKDLIPELGKQTKYWQKGSDIKGMGDPPLQPGTAVGSFTDGKYENVSGQNHSATFQRYDTDNNGRQGIVVFDQYNGKPAGESFIPFDRHPGYSRYTAGQFSVIK